MSGQLPNETTRLHFLDGMRGWGAVVVFYFHLVVKFLGEKFPEFSPLYRSFIMDGHLAVLMFFVISGFSLSISPIVKGDRTLSTTVLARYFRLAIPIFVTTLAGFVVLRANLNFNLEASSSGISKDWLGTFYHFDPYLRSVFSYSFFGVFFDYQGSLPYNSSLWTMSFEFFGSLSLFAFLFLVKSRLMRRLVATFLMIALLPMHPFIACFFGGYLIADLFEALTKRSLRYGSIYATFAVMVALSLAWAYRPESDVYWAALAITITTGCALSKPLNAFFSNNLSRFLGAISFPLYLSHIFVICTLSSWLYLALPSYGFSSLQSLAINILLSSCVSLMVALFFVPTEKLAISLSRGFGRLFVEADTAFSKGTRLPDGKQLISFFIASTKQ
jgi:peptidoglycan/LPS O-acetylase OafA/YrhL